MGNTKNNTELTLQNFVMIGPQGSGKGTQAMFLTKTYNLQHLSSGNLLRQISTIPSPLGQKIKNLIDNGILVPDELLIEVFHNELQASDRTRGLLIDGTPRTLKQTQILDQIFAKENLALPKAININISRQSAIDRLTKRHTCTKCQTPYLPSDISSTTGICEQCGGNVVIRSDDNIEAITQRLDSYYKETEPILDYYEKSSRLIKINGEQSIEDVSAEIKKAIEND
ncbi:MAG: nucleoside monophosphate kinase [bacterium]|nr:nucleoside monophosphate kinase [bacterium]